MRSGAFFRKVVQTYTTLGEIDEARERVFTSMALCGGPDAVAYHMALQALQVRRADIESIGGSTELASGSAVETVQGVGSAPVPTLQAAR